MRRADAPLEKAVFYLAADCKYNSANFGNPNLNNIEH